MGTRGTWGYAVDGVVKLAYNHCDSYPDGLGETILAHAKWVAANPEYSERAIRDLRMVSDDTPPTAEDVEHCKPWTDLGVARRTTGDWYCLLREAQGDPEATLAAGIMLAAGDDWPTDSLFCEYGYVIDLDGRFAGMGKPRDGAFGDGYYPIRLVKSWPLDALPDSLAGVESDDEDAPAVTR